ncbi:MAG: histidine kinase [Chitinophagaceae bacterium]|nr:histidine kinase [Chitinophagaceae bacterium]
MIARLKYSFFQTKYIFYFLYVLSYIGFLALDKRWNSRNNDWESYLPTFITHLSLMLFLVCTNAFILIPRLYNKKRIVLYIASLLLVITIYTFLKSIYDRHNAIVLFNAKNDPWDIYFWNSFVYAIWFVVVSSMLYISQNWYDHQQQVKNIRISQLQSELKYLRAQINPHFLFNGLNTVYGFIDIRNQRAREVLLQFSDLLRYNLYEADVDLVYLGKEADYLENYVALQKARSSPNLQVTLRLEIEDRHSKIAPLLFIPFVENAFKFSSHEENRENEIVISLAQKGNKITFECRNSYEKEDRLEGGIGLNNVKRRLELLYKDRYDLDIKGDEDNTWHIKLTLAI